MATEEKVTIIGIGENGLDGLTAAARGLIEAADLLIGDTHTLAAIGATDAEQMVVGTRFDEAVARIEKSPRKKIVVLASGDPLFYGVARYMCDRLGKQRFEVVPHVSSMQLAFARVKESWEEAVIDTMVIPNVHASVFPAIAGSSQPENLGALGILEAFSVASLIEGADAAVKAAKVELIEVRLAMALGGKAFATMTGNVAAVQAAIDAGAVMIGMKGLLVNKVVIASPSPQLYKEYI